MIFKELSIKGAFLIKMKKIEDERGFFMRAFCKNEFESAGLKSNFVQENIGFSLKRGTLRGMHFQKTPYAEVKLVQCTQGSLYDVIIDLRNESKTYKKWLGVELSENSYDLLYVPAGFAHGYITLKDNTELLYSTTEFYKPDYSTGARYDDPTLNIKWPIEPIIISDNDQKWKLLD